jgi:Tfp pilus assembly protein PilO
MKGRSSAAKLADFLTRTSQGKAYAVTIATILLALLVFFAGVAPAFDATLLQYSENQKKVVAIGDLQNKLASMQTLITEEEQKRGMVELLNQKLPDTLREEDIIIEIDKLAAQNSLNLVSVNFSQLERNKNISALYAVNSKVQGKYVTIDTEGDVQNLNTFVTALEKSTRVFNITNINFQRKERFNSIDAAANNTFRMNIRFETYYWGINTNSEVTV